MKDLLDSKVLLATVLTMVWLVVYMYFFAEKPVPPPAENEAVEQTQQADATDKAASSDQVAVLPGASTQETGGQTPQPPKTVPATAIPTTLPAAEATGQVAAPVETPPAEFLNYIEEEVIVENDFFAAIVSSRGGKIKNWKLKKYRETMEPTSPPVEMIHDLITVDPFVGGVSFSDANAGVTDDLPLTVESKTQDKIVLTGTTPAGVRVRKEMTFFPEKYAVQVQMELINDTGKTFQGNLATTLVEKVSAATGGGCAAGGGGCMGGTEHLKARESVAFVKRSLEKEQVAKAAQDLLANKEKGLPLYKEYNNGVFWTGFNDVYFLTAVASALPEETGMVLETGLGGSVLTSKLHYGDKSFGPGQVMQQDFLFYMGPKTKETLTDAGRDLNQALDYGWFGVIADVLVDVLKFFQGYVKNWGVAIIILTICVKMLLYPLTLKSYKSMNDMQRIQPLMKDLREKHKDDKAKLNEEMMRLYKEHGVNPAGGCLPMLLQLPIFIAFYRALYQSIELRHAGFFFWIQDLSAPDPYYVTPIIMGVSQWVSQKLTPTTADPAQAKMMQLMPVFFTFLFLNFPAGLVLYWLVNNLLTIAQQKWIQYKSPAVPLPVPAPKPAPENQGGQKKKKKKKGAGKN